MTNKYTISLKIELKMKRGQNSKRKLKRGDIKLIFFKKEDENFNNF